VRPDVELHLLTRSDDEDRWLTLAPAAELHAAVPNRRPARLLWEQTRAAALAARVQPDVWHGPHYTMPLGVAGPCVVTIHDLTFFDHPEWHERSKVWFFRRAIRVAARRADAVVCVSAATSQRLYELLSPRAEVVTVPHGVDHSRFRPARPDEEEADAAVLAAHGVAGRYVAFLGTVEPRKGLDVLLRAFDAVADAHPGVGLVVAGGRGWGAGPVDDELGRMRHRDRVVRTGYLAEEALPAFLRRAEVVAYPSRAEGFGLPVLEALACGARVVTTSGSVMDEVAGGAAALVPPGDAAALATALDAELTDAVAGRAPRREAGLAVAAGHTWARCADAHVALYRRVAGAM